MFVITSYKRFDGETEEELILRICEDKEQIGSWEDVAMEKLIYKHKQLMDMKRK